MTVRRYVRITLAELPSWLRLGWVVHTFERPPHVIVAWSGSAPKEPS